MLVTTATNLLGTAVNVATGLLVARLLGPTGRGELSAIMTIPTLLGALATLGLPEALVWAAAAEREKSGRLLSTCLVLTLAASLIFAALGWLLLPAALASQEPEVVRAARFYLLQVPVAAVMSVAPQTLRARGDFVVWNAVRTWFPLAWLLVLVGWSFPEHRSAAAVAMTFVAVRALLTPVALGISVLRLDRRDLRPDPRQVKRLLRFGIPNVLAVLPTMMNVRLDQVVMAAVLPARELGHYAVAVAWGTLSLPVLLAVGNVLLPRLAAEDDRARRRRMLIRAIRGGIVLSGVSGALLAASAPVAVPLLFGEAFASAVPAALILCLAGAVHSLNWVLREAARGLGRPGAVLRAELTGLAVTVVGLALLLPRFDIVGAALATVLGYATVFAALVNLVAHAAGISLSEAFALRASDVTMLVGSLREAVRLRGGARRS
ncbi:MAG: hypothetical protein KatS3mg008_0573 [Acidimicrobiales bacterium]|nr:MAG: hypothetical protein KatS3mg008_0573 [Acidimicrobiales bacterium]